MRKRRRLVCGVGINDADYQVAVNEAVGHKYKQIWLCPIYAAWRNMLRRCYSKKFQEKRPTYKGCCVHPDWFRFSVFRKWMVEQEWEGKELDKDILVSGNKVYGPDTCVLVPAALNMFMTDRSELRGKWPIGVSWSEHHQKFQSQCSDPITGKRGHIGFFDCPNQAHDAWRKRKHELACVYADQQTDRRIADALRNRYKKHE